MGVISYQILTERVGEIARKCGRRADDITIVAVSKGASVDAIASLAASGAVCFGESRVQEAARKIPFLPQEYQWHYMGKVQSNKAAYIVQHFSLVHSVDSLAAAEQLSKRSVQAGRICSILLEVNTSGETSKQGLSEAKWEELLPFLVALPSLSIEGLMAMAPRGNNEAEARRCFSRLRELREKWRCGMPDPQRFRHLSMGMSHDFPIAIEEGATLLRIGTALFG